MLKPFIPLYLLFAGVAAWACGDKIMLVMGGRAPMRPVRPASILAYPGHTASAALIRDLQQQPAVKKAGHRIQIAEDPAALENALKGGKYDLVVADVANANEVSQRLLSAPSRPIVLPVAFRASKEEQSAAQKTYHCLLRAPGSPDHYLSAIDQAMDWKLKTVNRR